MPFNQRDEFSDLVPLASPPRRPVATPQTPNQDAASGGSAASGYAGAARTRELTPLEVEALRLQNAERARGLAIPPGVTPQGLESMRMRAQDSQDLLRIIDQYEQHFQPYEGRLTLGEVLPWNTEGISQLNTDAESMLPIIRRMQRTPGDPQAQSETAQLGSWVPSTSTYDTTNRNRINNLRTYAQEQINRYNQLSQQIHAIQNPNQVRPGESMGGVGNLPPATESERSQNMGQNVIDNHGGTTATDDDFMQARVQANHLTSMARQGATVDQMNQYLSSIHRDSLSPNDVQRIRNYRGRGQGQRFPGFHAEVNPTGHSGPASVAGRLANTRVGAGVTRFAGAMSGDVGGLIPGEAGAAYRQGMNQLRQDFPTESLIGDVAGSIAPSAMLERAGAGLATRAGLDISEQGLSRGIPRLAANTTYGGVSGFANADEGQGLEGAVMGAGGGAIGGEAGNAASRVPGRLLRGIDNAPTRYLNAQGVPMTIGEIARATNTRLGNMVAGLEDRAAGLPGVGDIINMGRQHGRTGFNRAMFRQGAEPFTPPLPNGRTGPSPITETGTAGNAQMQAGVSRAYDDALNGVNVPLGGQYAADMAAANATGHATGAEMTPRLRAATNYIDNTLAQPGTPPSLSGPQLQAALQVLSRERAGIDGGMAQELRGAFSQASDAVTDAADRAAPGAIPQLRAANTANRNAAVIGDAVLAAKNQPGELVTPAQLRTSAVRNQTNYGGRNAARAGQEPFNELTTAGQAAQGNRVPDSGSAGRAAMLIPVLAASGGGAGALGNPDDRLGGAQGGAATALKYGGLAALLYSRQGQRLLSTVLTRRPQLLRDIGRGMNEGRIPVLTRQGQGTVPQIGSAFGAGIGRLLGYPPPQDDLDEPISLPGFRR